MIFSNELRLGNKVYYRDRVITVQQILFNSVVYETAMKINQELVGFGETLEPAYSSHVVEMVEEADCMDLKPINLTYKILEKCGFRNFVREHWIMSCGSKHIDFEFTEDGLQLMHPTPSRIYIRYYHQLQNFFFALTGKELEMVS